MKFNVIKTEPQEISRFRDLFLKGNNVQFVHNKCHDYGWATSYLVLSENEKVGYGSVWGLNNRGDRDTVFEFYLTKSHRKFAPAAFEQLLLVSGVTYIECQTNIALLPDLMYEFSQDINTESILFEDGHTTTIQMAGTTLSKREDRNKDIRYSLMKDDDEVATGGLMLNYNYPYADIYMDVKEGFRQQGFGALMVQELKREAYHIGRVPAARCNPKNKASKATLEKAGFKACGFMQVGKVRVSNPELVR